MTSLEGWSRVWLHDYLTEHIQYLRDMGGEYEQDYYVVTYHVLGREKNSHLWFIRDPLQATMFAIRWNGLGNCN